MPCRLLLSFSPSGIYPGSPASNSANEIQEGFAGLV